MNAIPMIVRCAVNQSKSVPTTWCIRCRRFSWLTATLCPTCVLKAMAGGDPTATTRTTSTSAL
jgi:hypothetical protein